MMTKAQLDEQLRELRIGAAEMAAEMGGIGDAEAFDIANGFITNEIATAIKKYYNVNDIQGFVANHIA
jgi:hypothetical protein